MKLERQSAMLPLALIPAPMDAAELDTLETAWPFDQTAAPQHLIPSMHNLLVMEACTISLIDTCTVQPAMSRFIGFQYEIPTMCRIGGIAIP